MKDYVVTIKVQEASEEDIALALEEVTKKVRDGFTSGKDVNLYWELNEDE